MMKRFFILSAVVALVLTSCDKVSPTGVLVSGTGVEDRVKMSRLYFLDHKGDYKVLVAAKQNEYTFLVGADSHLTTDDTRMREMLQMGLDNNDLLVAHLGDIADTKAEYYITLEDLIDEYRVKYGKKYYQEFFMGDENSSVQVEDPKYYVYKDTLTGEIFTASTIPYSFYPVVGNHDITHNGWALWSNIFHSSFYNVYVFADYVDDRIIYDRFIFLDTANGTLGEEQVKMIEEGVLEDRQNAEMGVVVRNTFVFSHTNIFRPSSFQFSSTFVREEAYFLLNQFVKWNASIVFCGHVHKWDDQVVGGVTYLTLDSMCEENNPEPGDYLVRVHVKKDGTVTWEKVHMNTRKK